MIRRMTDKLGHLTHGHQKNLQQQPIPGLPFPVTTHTHLEHRGSISTQRTSESSKRGESVDETRLINESLFPYQRRPKGIYRLSDFIFQRTLGTGSFGRVHLVRSKHNLRFYAIVKSKQIDHTNNEQQMLLAVQHPFIINLWGSFQDATNLYMVMDFVPGGELFTLLRRSNSSYIALPRPCAKFYAAEVALALHHLHNLDINILLGLDGHIKIADFGFAKYCPNTTWTLCGTPTISHLSRYNKSVDWYALGVLIFEMLTGLPPFHRPDDSPMALYARIQSGPSCIRFPAINILAKDLILKFLESNPSKRYGNLRNGAGDVFSHPWFREVDWEKLRNRDIVAPYLPKVTGEAYEEGDAAAQYGLAAEDAHGVHFPDFEYTAV
ncbi:kinase-like domain-containing protein [Russula vinacea]|nr:kinase-like domain-containing protein [Russula vinacea]